MTPEKIVAELMGSLDHHSNCSSKAIVKGSCNCYARNRWKMLDAIHDAEKRGYNAAIADAAKESETHTMAGARIAEAIRTLAKTRSRLR